MAKPIPDNCAGSITVTFAGIVFDDTNFGFGDVNQSFPINKDRRLSDSISCIYNLKTAKSGAKNAYAQLFIKLQAAEGDGVLFQLFSDVEPLGRIVFHGAQTATPLVFDNWYTYGGTATIELT